MGYKVWVRKGMNWEYGIQLDDYIFLFAFKGGKITEYGFRAINYDSFRDRDYRHVPKVVREYVSDPLFEIELARMRYASL